MPVRQTRELGVMTGKSGIRTFSRKNLAYIDALFITTYNNGLPCSMLAEILFFIAHNFWWSRT